MVVQQPDTPIPPIPVEQPSASPIEARLQLAAIVDSSDDAIISKDLGGIIKTWNAAATRIFGYQPHEIIGKSILTLIPLELHSEEPEIIRKVKAGERIEHFETRRRRKDGELIQISLTISPIRDTTGRIIGVSKIARDITERKRTEAALFESERMAAIGRMAASIAHEVNNPLEAILNLSYLLTQNASLDGDARKYASLLLDEVVRVSEITKQTLAFYRDTTQVIEVDVAALLEGLLKLHRPMIDQKSIKVSTRLQHHARVWARPGELRQVFTNLLINAVDALPLGGQIRVSAIHSHQRQAVFVTISDNGSGIQDAIREKVFEPFFSTKLGKGTGLGLWVTLGIVRKYGGTIRLRTSTNDLHYRGSMFRVSIPCNN